MEPRLDELSRPALRAAGAPEPTLAPAAVAAGAALLGYGIVASVAFVLLGLALVGGGLVAWLAALCREHADGHRQEGAQEGEAAHG